MRIMRIFIAILTLLLVSSVCVAEDSFSPWDFNRGEGAASTSVHQGKASPAAYMLKQSIRFFIHCISRVDGDRCPMYPTCSAYGLQAVEKHGFIVGVVMIADRLIHESSEMTYAPLIEVGGTVRFLDPVDNNDFWWYSKGRP